MGTASAHHILLMDKKGDPEKRRVLVDLKREVSAQLRPPARAMC